MEARRSTVDEDSKQQEQQRRKVGDREGEKVGGQLEKQQQRVDTSLLHADPLQSIANVLNHHHQSAQQQQRKSLEVSTKLQANSSTSGQQADYLAPDLTPRQVETANDLDEEEAASVLATSSKQQQRRVNKQQTSSSKQQPEAGQVDQGNSYLYAYNDFITATSASANAKVARQAPPLKEKHRLIQAESLQQASTTTTTKRNFFSSTKQKVFAVATRAHKTTSLEVSSPSPFAQTKREAGGLFGERPPAASGHKSPTQRRQRRHREKSTTTTAAAGKLAQVLTRLSPASDDEQQATTRNSRELQSEQLVEGEVFANSEALLEHDDDDDDQEEQQEEEEDDEDEDTLSYILHRHNLLLAQQERVQQREQLRDLHWRERVGACQHHKLINKQSIEQAADVQLVVCQHQLAAAASSKINSSTSAGRSFEVEQEDNSNHLRQYLQIEENFNSYKAAKRRHLEPHERLGLQKTTTTTIGGPTFQGAEGASRASGSRKTLAASGNLHLPLANYIMATNELVENDEFSYQNQLARRVPPISADYSTSSYQQQPQVDILTQNLSRMSPSSSMISLPNNQQQQSNLALINHQNNIQNQNPNQNQQTRSYLQLFKFVKPARLLGAASGGKSKMFASTSSHHQQQPGVGQLAGQAGAYYVTNTSTTNPTNYTSNNGGGGASSTSSSAASSEANLTADNLISPTSQQHCAHHLGLTNQQQHLSGHHLSHAQMLGHHHHQTHTHHQHQAHLSHHHHHNHHHLTSQQQHYTSHPHHHHHHQHYPLTTSSDSSLGSSGAFASSAMRATSSWLRDFCSKKCLFFACLMLILFIFILVISLSAYLNFLTSSSKPNLQPLSGRLRLDLSAWPSGDFLLMRSLDNSSNNATNQEMQQQVSLDQFAARLFNDKTSLEFLQKQSEFETIIRGAMDRTQAPLKSYPNHLVKLEVYAIRSAAGAAQVAQASSAASLASLWVYFRLFLNKRTLMLDSQLMRRKSPDEHLERQFLPSLTQQTLQSGFEQLLAQAPSSLSPTANKQLVLVELGGNQMNETTIATGAQQLQQMGINSRRFGQQIDLSNAQSQSQQQSTAANKRLTTRAARANNQQASAQAQAQQQQQLKSFDEQINRLMYLIEAIDLQSILVTPEFDMLQTFNLQPPAAPPQSMSQPIVAATGQQARPPSQTTTSTTTAASSTATQTMAPATTTTSATTTTTGGNVGELTNVMVASGGSARLTEVGNGGSNKLTPSQRQQPSIRQVELEESEQQVSVNSGGQPTKFTLQQGYKENTTRPIAATTTSTVKPTLFLVNQSQKKQVPVVVVAMPASNLRPAAAASLPKQQAGASTQRPPGGNTQVVRLVSGQPIVSQSGQLLATSEKPPLVTSANSNKRLQATQREASSTTTTTTSATPSSPRPTPSGPSGARQSIEELWTNALSGGGNVSTSSGGNSNLQLFDSNARSSGSHNNNAAGRLITVTTIGSGELDTSSQAPASSQGDWQKISGPLDVTDSPAVRGTNLNLTAAIGQRPAKVAPPMSFAGSLMTQQAQQPQQQSNANGQQAQSSTRRGQSNGAMGNQVQRKQAQQQLQDSAVILSRDFGASSTAATLNQAPQVSTFATSSSGGGGNFTTSAPPTTSQRPKQKKQQKQRNNNNNQHNSSSPNDQQRQPPSGRNGTTTTGGGQANSTVKPSGKPPKVAKKVSGSLSEIATAAAARNQTGAATALAQQQSNVTTTAASNGKGIRIVDNFLASLGANGGPTERVRVQAGQQQQQQATSSTLPSALTTIELTRSTTTMVPPLLEPSANLGDFVVSNQQARPGTTSFSGQWRPLGDKQKGMDNLNDEAEKDADFWTSGRNRTRPNMALIISTERLPETLNRATGSQSPFAMPNQMINAVSNVPGRLPASGFTNRFRAPQSTTSSSNSRPLQRSIPQNDFESHRVSRMRQAHHAQRTASEHNAHPFGLSTSSSSTSSSSSLMSSSTSSTTTTSSSLNLVGGSEGSPAAAAAAANTRIVDDFMITTDRNNEGRGSTLLPPLVISGLEDGPRLSTTSTQSIDLEGPTGPSIVAPLPPSPSNLLLTQVSKKTRGPFAFETLRSLSPTSFSINGDDKPTSSSQTLSTRSGDLAPSLHERASENFHLNSFGEQLPAATTPSGRAERSPAAISSVGPATSNFLNNSSSQEQPEFGDRRQPEVVGGASSSREQQLIRCPHYGCKSKESGEFVCLNKTQICDDFTDCRDESDELDCVSLLKLDPMTHKMSFSNGAGIIYLNRRGSLAPMCIDYYHPTPSTNPPLSPRTNSDLIETARFSQDAQLRHKTNSAHELEALKLDEALKRQNELIRQINAIGQYACNLQSFKRLVSVKINHHNQVDAYKLINSSKVFHKLSIIRNSETAPKMQRTNLSGESYKSGHTSQLEVEIGTSSECPSQRTVFVKCGSFECGQDAISVQQHQQQRPTARVEQKRRKATASGAIINDFPWLVKLYWLNSLACHGYLIDESWLIAARECFHNNNNKAAHLSGGNNEMMTDGLELPTGWTAEISNEHYGNDDYKSIESNRRLVRSLLFQPNGGVVAPIVLAKLERPVRFSPLNRPICLPTPNGETNNSTNETKQLANLRDCFTVSLPLNSRGGKDKFNSNGGASLSDLSPPTHDQQLAAAAADEPELILNKVELLQVDDCHEQQAANNNHATIFNGNTLICAAEINPKTTEPSRPPDATRVLICSQATSTIADRPRWTVIGVQTTDQANGSSATNKRLFTRVSSQIDWIVDTMNPKVNGSYLDRSNNPGQHFDTTTTPFATGQSASSSSHRTSSLAGSGSGGDFVELNKLTAGQHSNQLHLQELHQSAACSQFKCSSGECLSWSRICDGLYDCSSHDDENDCHK